MTTGQLIKSARKRAGLTQKELGEKLGISYQSVAQWENDLRNPKIETLNRIAEALGIEAIELVPTERQSEYIDSYMQYIKECKEAGAPYVPELSGPPPTAAETQRGNLLFPYDHLLNEEGQREAVKRLWELAMIPPYQRERPPATPQSPPAPSEGKDTTPPPDAPETPPEGK